MSALEVAAQQAMVDSEKVGADLHMVLVLSALFLAGLGGALISGDGASNFGRC